MTGCAVPPRAESGSTLRLVVAPDSFKGSLSAAEVAAAIATGLRQVWPDAQVLEVPLADGGEGTLEAVLRGGGQRRFATVRGAAGGERRAAWGEVRWEGASAALLEVAQVVPITDTEAMALAVTRRDTRGLGELLGAVLDAGHRQLLFALGGSSTNDGGAGLLNALGVVYRDAAGAALDPTPEALVDLARVDTSALDSRLAGGQLTVLSDVTNPLCGSLGATAVFGPQKGLLQGEIGALDQVIKRYAGLCEAAFGRKVMHLPGAGAAGGLGFALLLLGARLRSGAEVVAELAGLDAALTGADWLITGEGRSDLQTLLGKAPLIAAEHAARRGVPALLLSGSCAREALAQLHEHFAACFALPFGPMSLAQAMAEAPALLSATAIEVAQLIAAASSVRA